MKEKIMRYSESFRRMVVTEYETGTNIPALKQKYGIRGSETIPRWIQKYGKAGFRHELVRIQKADEINYVRELEKKVDMMEKVIGRMTLEKIKSDTILEILEETYGEEIKKNIPSGLLEQSNEPKQKAQKE